MWPPPLQQPIPVSSRIAWQALANTAQVPQDFSRFDEKGRSSVASGRRKDAMLLGPDGKRVGRLSREYDAQYRAWRNNLPDHAFAAIESQIATYCATHDHAAVKYFAASVWTGTSWEPLLEACDGNAEDAAKFLGQILWRYLDGCAETWWFHRPASLDGESVGMVYVRE